MRICRFLSLPTAAVAFIRFHGYSPREHAKRMKHENRVEHEQLNASLISEGEATLTKTQTFIL